MSQFQENCRKEGRTEGRVDGKTGPIHRTLPETTGVQKLDTFCMIFSSTPNSYFKTKTNASSCCLLSFKQYLQVRINKMINSVDYHPSPSELISRIHPFRVLSLYFLNFLTNFCRYNCDKSSNLWCSDFHSCLPPGESLP